MALPHAILVSLCEQSGSGYELTRRFDRSIGYFWSATHQQIYRTLRTMEADGWVSAKVVPQQGRPDKKVYTVSDSGRAELARWIAAPIGSRGSGSSGSGAGRAGDGAVRELAVKLRGAAYGDRAALIEQVVALRAERAQLLDTYRGFAKNQFSDPASLRGSALHQYLVLRGGIRTEEGTIDWLDEITAALQKRSGQENL
ncbi:PadR family transcriptional regulator [Mycobacterium sp. 1245111.1]|uniref:PadR family transcriptional regulator n=1 Tax=Mycobacterium sp. 1245111.1 TaxID=1834073 RepID=UPI0007FFF025|nr:PadR family transcriptional regulator [Mycobacterium sp. 1245111.1]OBK37996.1 PadR family transcriptional regulator [Mycobacterium sp. 1245111.1]